MVLLLDIFFLSRRMNLPHPPLRLLRPFLLLLLHPSVGGHSTSSRLVFILHHGRLFLSSRPLSLLHPLRVRARIPLLHGRIKNRMTLIVAVHAASKQYAPLIKIMYGRLRQIYVQLIFSPIGHFSPVKFVIFLTFAFF